MKCQKCQVENLEGIKYYGTCGAHSHKPLPVLLNLGLFLFTEHGV
jgi:hypothetical protein